MSKAKPWPTAANRHRVDAVLKAGEIVVESRQLTDLLTQLREAISDNNIALAMAIAATLDSEARFIREAARAIGLILESAPSEER